MSVAQWVHCNSANSRSVRTPAHTFLRPHPALQRPVPGVRLTAKERILIHLADYAKYADVVEVTPEMGQEGIAHAAGIYVQHVRQFLDPLLKEGLVRERTAHVKGHRRRLKVYDLTDSGRLSASRLREQVRGEPIRVRDATGVRATTVGELVREASGKITIAALMHAASEGEVVDLAVLAAATPSGTVARLAEAPRLDAFVGRREELEALTREDAGPRVFFIRGVAGIGKSSLAAKACEKLKGSHNVYWHQIRPWDTRPSVLAGLGDFLAATGRPGLRAVLARGEAAGADSVLRDDLRGARCVVVFDDAQEAIPEVLDLLRFLKDAIADAPDARAIVLSRRAAAFYDRRDVAIRHIVQEIDLQGLDRDDIAALLPADADGKRLATIAKKLGGHPLFVELLRSAPARGIAAPSLTDVRRFIEEEIYTELSEGERRMMKTAALYEVPFPREAAFVDPSLSHDVFLSLTTKSLIRPMGEDAFGVHDTIRDFFTSILTESERKTLGPAAIEQLLRIADAAGASKDFVAALNALSNALELATSRERHASLSERLGDAYERLGDLPAAMAAYAEAMRHVDEPESLARLHRKSATALQVRGENARAAVEIEAGFKALGERASVERGRLNLHAGRVAAGQEDWTEARDRGEAALASFRAMGDSQGEAETLLQLGASEIRSPGARPNDAERYLLGALQALGSGGDSEFQVRVNVALANLYAYRIGDIERARRHLAAVRALEPSIADPHVLRSVLMLQGWFALYQEADFDAAEGFFTRAADLARRIHDRRTVVFADQGLAQALFFRGDVEAARRRLEAFAVELREVAVPGEEVEALWSIAECALILGDLDGFRKIAAEVHSPRVADGLDARPLQARVLEGLERLTQGDRDGTRAAFDEAVRIAETSYLAGEAVPTAFAHFYYGVALRAMGDESQGIAYVRKARELLKRSGFRAQLDAIVRDEPRVVASLRGGTAPPRTKPG